MTGFRGVAAALAAGLAATFLAGSAAQAAPAHRQAAAAGGGPCNSGSVCLWTGTYYTGDRWQWPNSEPTLPAFIFDKASSAVNHGRNCTAYLYAGAGFSGGEPLPIYRGDFRDDLSLVPRENRGNWNNTIASVKWCTPA
jgi:hypothetical protein